MDLILVQRLLNIYSWAIAGLIMIIVASIAIFYQKKFGVNTFYYIYFIPLILFLIILMQLFDIFSLETESLEFIGSMISFLVSYSLYRKMAGVK
jgi:hypothetical protein